MSEPVLKLEDFPEIYYSLPFEQIFTKRAVKGEENE